MAEINRERGDRIRRLREDKKMSQDQVAEVVGATDGSHVSKWENGKGISRTYLVKLAKLFEVAVDYIEHGDKVPRSNSHNAIEDLQKEYRSRKGKRGFSDSERDLLLEVLLENAESLAINLRRLIEIEKNRSDE